MNESILDTIKKMLGIDSNYDVFDTDIIIQINSAFFLLMQLGVGPEDGFSITGSSETWDQFTDLKKLEAVKNYIFIRTKLGFDPPTSSFVLNSYEKIQSELEWRLNVEADRDVIT